MGPDKAVRNYAGSWDLCIGPHSMCLQVSRLLPCWVAAAAPAGKWHHVHFPKFSRLLGSKCVWLSSSLQAEWLSWRKMGRAVLLAGFLIKHGKACLGGTWMLCGMWAELVRLGSVSSLSGWLISISGTWFQGKISCLWSGFTKKRQPVPSSWGVKGGKQPEAFFTDC